MTATAPFIDVVQHELEAYRRGGRPLHLAHAARALKEALESAGSGTAQEQSDVVAAKKRR